ncbi:MAG: serine hydrolase domain-containing protein [Acidobacteriota bacterium]
MRPAQVLMGLLGWILLVGSAGWASQLPAESPDLVGMSSSRLQLIDGLVEEAIRHQEVPGAVVMVARRGRLVYSRAFGLRALEPSPAPLRQDDIFDVASLTKIMATATSVMILVENGKLILSDPVAKYIPEFARRGKDGVLVHHLLTHFSGLRPDLDLDDPWQGYDRAVELACRERLLQEPGQKFVYSDINYLLLGEIVRRVSGQPLDVFAAERIFRPLGMLDTGFNPHGEKLDRVVPTERRDGQMLQGQVHDPTAFRMGGVAGHAGLFSTAPDALVWAQMILGGGEYQGVRILSPLAVRKMTASQSPAGSPDRRGFGFDIDTRLSRTRGDLFPVGSFGHTGFTGTSIWIDAESETVVILFSSRLYPDGKGDAVPLRSKVASVVAASILDVPAAGVNAGSVR